MSDHYSLAELLAQESELQFDFFNNDTAWQLGSRLKLLADAQNASVLIEVYAYNQRLFCFAMSGTQPDNQHWVKRKRQSVLRFGHSSAYIGRYNQAKNRDFEQQLHIDAREYCAHGGSFPIRIKNSGVIGAITVSGLASDEDHQMVIDAIAGIVGKNTGDIEV